MIGINAENDHAAGLVVISIGEVRWMLDLSYAEMDSKRSALGMENVNPVGRGLSACRMSK